VLDCSDNFATRHAVNRACVAAGRPLVSGAAIRVDGQIAVFDPRVPGSPCYHCLFGEGEEIEETRCATMGVFAPVVGIVGATQAAEALKLLAGVGETLAGRLLLLDAYGMHWREVAIRGTSAWCAGMSERAGRSPGSKGRVGARFACRPTRRP
jgi:adenylyltransferase/sulfurtransferase